MKNLTIINRQPASGLNRGDVIAAWTYTYDDWKHYLRWQRQRRRKNAFTQIMMVVSLSGMIGLMQVSKACGYQAMKKKTIIITATGVVMRKKFIPFNTYSRELQSIHIIESMPAFILAIISQSVAGKRPANTILIPVPKGRLGEAVRLLMRFEKNKALAEAER